MLSDFLTSDQLHKLMSDAPNNVSKKEIWCYRRPCTDIYCMTITVFPNLYVLSEVDIFWYHVIHDFPPALHAMRAHFMISTSWFYSHNIDHQKYFCCNVSFSQHYAAITVTIVTCNRSPAKLGKKEKTDTGKLQRERVQIKDEEKPKETVVSLFREGENWGSWRVWKVTPWFLTVTTFIYIFHINVQCFHAAD